MQKGNVLIFLLVGIVVLGAIGGAFYLGRSTTPKPAPVPVITSPTPQSTSSQSERNFCSTKLNFCIEVPIGWKAEETLNPQGGSGYIVSIKDQNNDNNSIDIRNLTNGLTIKQMADSSIKNSIPGTIRKNIPSIKGQSELLIFPTSSLDPSTVVYYYGELFIQTDPKSDIFRLSALSTTASGELVGNALVKIGSSLKITK